MSQSHNGCRYLAAIAGFLSAMSLGGLPAAAAGSLYGVYHDIDIGYAAVLAGIEPSTGAVNSSDVIGEYLGDGTVAPLQSSLSALAFGDGHLYGVYSDTDIGYPAVLADIDPSTGDVLSSHVIGEYFGDGTVAPLQTLFPRSPLGMAISTASMTTPTSAIPRCSPTLTLSQATCSRAMSSASIFVTAPWLRFNTP
jgi:hypothetical protein